MNNYLNEHVQREIQNNNNNFNDVNEKLQRKNNHNLHVHRRNQTENDKKKNDECAGHNENNKKINNQSIIKTIKTKQITGYKKNNIVDRKLINFHLSRSWNNTDKNMLLSELNNLGYHLGKRIGKGSYSKVYYAEHYGMPMDNKTGDNYCNGTTTTSFTINKQIKPFSYKPIACKIIDGYKTSTEYYFKFLPRELKILQKITHPHIVTVHAILEMGPFICFIMDYCPYGDLLDYIRLRGAIAEKKSHLYFSQIVSAIHYLHSNDISHRDLKCENILIQHRYCIKLTDFGFSRTLSGSSSSSSTASTSQQYCKDGTNGGGKKRSFFSQTFCGSVAYAAPEVLKGIPYDPKLSDVWSIGCVLFIMITGSMPYDDENIMETIKKQENHEIDYPQGFNVNHEIKDLIREMLEYDVQKRATINKVINHPWLIF